MLNSNDEEKESFVKARILSAIMDEVALEEIIADVLFYKYSREEALKMVKEVVKELS